MKTNRTLRSLDRSRLWAGLLALLLIVCAEFWLVCRFSRDCARSLALETAPAGFPVSEVHFAVR
ncbi:MAG: hypothetical protein KIS67_18540 [Verrucomicrobiae bacterium]|nr:hypothetical protein [Verrucomicrobiae bacterium]